MSFANLEFVLKLVSYLHRNMDAKTPMERTLPIRMRFKENRLRYLQAQLKFQNNQLEETLQENMKFRQQIQKVKQQRIYLMESLAEHRKKFEANQEEILNLQMKLLAVSDEHLESSVL